MGAVIDKLVLGGCIILIISVLNSILVYYMSFMRISLKVWKVVVRIQRDFMGGGSGVG